jgi:hypothetical protein
MILIMLILYNLFDKYLDQNYYLIVLYDSTTLGC